MRTENNNNKLKQIKTMDNNTEFSKPFTTFSIVFQITKTIMFEVSYHKVGSNTNPYFSTSAMVFNRPKTDYKLCGQCQASVLPTASVAKMFYKKWDKHHCKDIMDGETYKELLSDLDELKEKYNYVERFDNVDVTFYQCKELSMSPLKKTIKGEKNDI